MELIQATQAITVHRSPMEELQDEEGAHLWVCDLDNPAWILPGDITILSIEERAKLFGLKSPRQEERYLTRCVFVRKALAKILNCHPASLRFEAGPFGKPELSAETLGAVNRPDMRFNIAHSRNVLVFGASFYSDIGVDVEVVDPKTDIAPVAGEYLSPEGYNHLLSLPVPQRAELFYRLWTAREAFVKGEGIGMASFPGALVLDRKTPLEDRWHISTLNLKVGNDIAMAAIAMPVN